MKHKLLPLLITTFVLATGTLLVACDGDDDPETPVLTPSATVEATVATEAPTSEASTATPDPETPTPETATETPEPGGTGEPSCPIEEVVCNLGESLEVALEEGNYEAIVDLMQPRDETCPGGTPQGAGGPFPLCEDAPQGEVRTGYQLARRYSEGYIVDRAGVVLFLEGFVNAVTPGVTDDYGSGELRLQAVSCFEKSGDACAEATVIFAAILEGNRREVLVFSVPLPADPDQPITMAKNGIVLEDEESIIFEDGGQIADLGQVHVLD